MGDIQADISKIKEKLNWKPKIEFEEGLKKILKVCQDCKTSSYKST